MLSLHKLELFVYVARAGSISKAADHFLMSQPNVSQHIQDLEADFGEQLLIRKYRGVVLTPAGETLLQYAQEILRLVAEAKLAITDVSRLSEGSLALAATPGIGIYVLPECVERFRARYPQFTVSIKTGTTVDVLQFLAESQCDAGLIEGELDDLRLPSQSGVLVLDDVKQFVIVSQAHPWWNESALSIQALDDQPVILRQVGSQSRAWLDKLLRSYNVRLRYVGEFDNPEMIKRALLAGNAFAILPAYVVRHEVDSQMLRLLPLTDCELRRQLKLIWNKEWPFSPITYAFLQHLAHDYPAIQTILDVPRRSAPGAVHARRA
ncbi:LysR family transcriptional regulator [Roseiflexus sp.]|uniref:LysR family transcriptional regulator n=1 Tax=Roseiflexus sp. TaxID=2562120 RepID=UPI00398AAC6A